MHKPQSSTTFKPSSQNRLSTRSQVGCQIVSFYHLPFKQNWFCALIHCHFEVTAHFVLLIWRLCVWSVFKIFEHGEDEQEIH